MLRTPKADEAVVIYETRKNRVSGSHTQVIDDRPNGGKYILRCATHDFTSPRNVRLATEAESHKSHEWCPKCTDTRDATKVAAAPLVVTLNASPDAVKAFVGSRGEVVTPKDARPSVEEILDIIGRATSKATCLAKFTA
jgi:hypothetical protein